MNTYLNNALHEVSLVIGEPAGRLVLDEILQGTDIAETQGFDVPEQPRRSVVLQERRISNLAGNRRLRSMNKLGILFKGRLDGLARCASRLFLFKHWRGRCRLAHGSYQRVALSIRSGAILLGLTTLVLVALLVLQIRRKST